jgi:hypothetical protein
VQLSTRQSDGSTLREHLQVAADNGTRADPRLGAAVPPEMAALWAAFVALDNARPAGMGKSAIPPSELIAWQQLHGVRLTPWEAETLMAMDRAVLALSHASTPARH